MNELNTRDRAIIALYDTGQSYASVARKMGIGTSTVQDTMRRHAHKSIRGNNEWRNPGPDEGLTLTALALYRIGPCISCECEIVSYTREHGQECGLCTAWRAA
jgi:transposase-like protein